MTKDPVSRSRRVWAAILSAVSGAVMLLSAMFEYAVTDPTAHAALLAFMKGYIEKFPYSSWMAALLPFVASALAFLSYYHDDRPVKREKQNETAE